MQPHEAGEGGIGELPAERKLVLVEPGIVVLPGPADDVMARVEGLDDDPCPAGLPARPGPTPGSGSGRSARRARKSGMFREASAAMTPTSVIPGKSCPLVIICVPTRMSISPRSSSRRILSASPFREVVSLSIRAIRAVGEELPRLLLDPFRSRAVAADAASLAGGAAVGGLHREVAVVAFQNALGGMMGERDLAVRAGEGVAAVRAEEKGMEALAG